MGKETDLGEMDKIWGQAREELQRIVGADSFATWIDPLKLAEVDEAIAANPDVAEKVKGGKIAADIFGDPRQVEFRSLTSANRIEALEDGQVDLVIRSMSITCERRERVTFSVPYYQAYQRVLAVRGSGIENIEDLEGKRVCVASGTTSAARLWEELERITLEVVRDLIGRGIWRAVEG